MQSPIAIKLNETNVINYGPPGLCLSGYDQLIKSATIKNDQQTGEVDT